MIPDRTLTRRLLMGLATGMLVLAGGHGDAGSATLAPVTPGPGREVVAFDRFVAASGPLCLQRPAAACVDAGWVFADRDADQGLSVAELQRLRDDVRAWALWRADDLYAPERSLLVLGLLLVDGVGVERLHALYDADGDGLIDRAELLADVHLDARPLGEVLLDPEAVDRAAIAARLGLPPGLLERLQP
ncbi:MAG TPA: hypothetical protein VFV80_10415 [Geminicoccaceae bacterium]|nr:hypothetical protein [Geminicoccaceae bacterium]